MSYTFYKVLHLTAIICFFISLGALLSIYYIKSQNSHFLKKPLMFLHGISHFIIFFAGFGLIAKLAIKTPWPLVIYIKLIIWILLGMYPWVIKKLLKDQKIWKLYASFSLLLALFLAAILSAQYI